MREKRLYVECDRCHTAITLKQDRNGSTIGPAASSWADCYEDLPEGWLRTEDRRDLCPDCAKKYEQMMKSFYGERR